MCQCNQHTNKTGTHIVLWVWHCVEWSYCQWELIQDIEVSVILQEKVSIVTKLTNH